MALKIYLFYLAQIALESEFRKAVAQQQRLIQARVPKRGPRTRVRSATGHRRVSPTASSPSGSESGQPVRRGRANPSNRHARRQAGGHHFAGGSGPNGRNIAVATNERAAAVRAAPRLAPSPFRQVSHCLVGSEMRTLSVRVWGQVNHMQHMMMEDKHERVMARVIQGQIEMQNRIDRMNR